MTKTILYLTSFLAISLLINHGNLAAQETANSPTNGRIKCQDPSFSFKLPQGFYAKESPDASAFGAQAEAFNEQTIYNFVDREASNSDPAIVIKIVRLKRHMALDDSSWVGDPSQHPPGTAVKTLQWDLQEIAYMKMPIPGGDNVMLVSNIPLLGEAIGVMVGGPRFKEAQMEGQFRELISSIRDDVRPKSGGSFSGTISMPMIAAIVGGFVLILGAVGVVLALTVFKKPKRKKKTARRRR